MADGRMTRLAAMVLAVVCGVVLVGLAHAQGPDELPAMLAEVDRLHREGKYADAISIAERAVTLARERHGEEHVEFAEAIARLGKLYFDQGRFSEAELLLKRSLAVREKALGPEHFDVGTLLFDLSRLYALQGRNEDAMRLMKRGADIVTKNTAALINSEKIRKVKGFDTRDPDAETAIKRRLAEEEQKFGLDHPKLGWVLDDLAKVYTEQHRYAEAEVLYKRSLAVRETGLGPEHLDVGTSLSNLAQLHRNQGNYDEAAALLERRLAILEKALGPGPEHGQVDSALADLASLYTTELRRYADAEPLYRRRIAIREKALGSEHPSVGDLLAALGQLYQQQGLYAEAEPLHKRSLAIATKALGPDHPDVGWALGNLAQVAYAQSDWEGAAEYWRRSTGIIQRRVERGLAGGQGEARRLAFEFGGLVKVTHRVQTQHPTATIAAEMFETAQWVRGSEAAVSLAQMAARSAKGSPLLAGLVRERQDLVGEWEAKDKLLITAKSEPPAKRNAEAEKALADRLAAIDRRRAEIDLKLAQEFPDYVALASAAPVSVADVQIQLAADEALVLFLDTPEWRPLAEETFVWVVTKTRARWVRSDLGTAALVGEVAALRCGLDRTAWYGEGALTCAKTLGIPLAKAPRPNQPLPLSHARGHKLYLALFGKAEDLIKGKHLLIVPSGPLTQLPFQVLVTKADRRTSAIGPQAGRESTAPAFPPWGGEPAAPFASPQGRKEPALARYRAAAWLAREHAVTILPAVSSLKALRRVGRPSTAPKPMLGFGNPLLDGPDERYAASAKLAQEKQRCPEARRQGLAALAGLRGGVVRVETRGGLADVSHVKGQVPLPETADELCTVAQDLKAEASDVRLGAQATEREIKRLSASGELAMYRMVHFATHGVLAGQLDGTQEPGLILTPPEKATEEDDGYLSASEIAGLKLDADWVILSACNTAAGATTSAEALSGLARAFIYAQARALLVSHWEVDSAATVKLITAAFREMGRDPKVGRAEAMRRSMLALIDKGKPEEAHPAYWAPFVVVGEGATAR